MAALARLLGPRVRSGARREGGKGWRRGLGLVDRNWARQRFYKEALVSKHEGGYGVCLDQRSLRTPLRRLFLVPSEALAQAVAQEWSAQGTPLQPALMHLTRLCNTVLDEAGGGRSAVTAELTEYLNSDTLRYRAPEPEDLVELQSRQWDPQLDWFNTQFGMSVQSVTSLLPEPLPARSTAPIHRFMASMDQWRLIAFQHAVESSKSLILSCALMCGRINSDEATELALLETQHQAARWGRVEWQHGVEWEDLRSRLAAAALLDSLSHSH